LFADERTYFGSKGHEFRVGKDTGPEGAAVGVVVKLPHVNQLVDGAHIAGEIAHQFLRVLGQGGPAFVGIEGGQLGHFADDGRVSAQFINCHKDSGLG
jgi:hypothetical protein